MAEDLDYIFRPKSIAVIGASRSKGTIGWNLLHNLIEYEFNGSVFPVNPSAEVIHSIKCYKSISEIPYPVDLAIVAVRKELVNKVVQECGLKGIRGLVIISAGFKEVGGVGIKRQEELLEITRKYGIRLIGPNCMGIINTAPDVKMDATFASIYPLPGNVAFITQSGALGVSILEYARRIGLGFSIFASIGNMADITSCEIMEYCGKDPSTQCILLYLENFSDPWKFTRIARAISRHKPIIAVKSGKTSAGARAAISHTGSLAVRDIAVDVLFEQCGVIRVSCVEELFELALAFAHQPLPKGNGVAIISNGGGPAILATDACINLGLQLAQLTEITKQVLRCSLPEEASVENPVDMLPAAGPDQYHMTLRAVVDDPMVDAVIVIFVPPVTANALEVARNIAQISTTTPKPILGCLMGFEIQSSEFTWRKETIPVYAFPESAVKALAAMTKYAQWKKKPSGLIKEFKVDKIEARAIIQEARRRNQTLLTGPTAKRLIATYGIPTVSSQIVHSIEETLRAAENIGYPIVLKLNTPVVPHKSDIGGVLLDIRNEAEVIKGYQQIQTNLKKRNIDLSNFSLEVQEMVTRGKDTILGMSVDPVFGPLMMFGMGGIYVEVMKDVVFRLHPLTDLDGYEMVRSIKGYPLLAGVRGERSVDIDFLVECLLRLSQLVNDFPEITEIDINPFIICEKSRPSKVVDIRIVLSSKDN